MTDPKITDEEELDEEGSPVKPEAESSESPVEGGEIEPPKKTVEEKEEKEEEIPVRRSAEQHIIARQKRTIEKLRSREKEEESYDSEEESGEEEKDLDSKLDRKVKQHLAPVLHTLRRKVDEDELQGLLSQEPEAAKYQDRIRKWMVHPKYEGVPPSVIYHHLAFSDTVKTGEKRKKAADLEASSMRGGGSPRRPTVKSSKVPTPDELDNMDDAEFQALQDQAMRGVFVPK